MMANNQPPLLTPNLPDEHRIQQLDEVLLREPGNIDKLMERAHLLRTAGKFEPAFKDLQRVLQIQPKNSTAASMAQQVLAVLSERLSLGRSKLAGSPQELLRTATTAMIAVAAPKASAQSSWQERFHAAEQMNKLASSNPSFARALFDGQTAADTGAATTNTTNFFSLTMPVLLFEVSPAITDGASWSGEESVKIFRYHLAKTVHRVLETLQLSEVDGFVAYMRDERHLPAWVKLFENEDSVGTIIVDSIGELYKKLLMAVNKDEGVVHETRLVVERFVLTLVNGASSHSGRSPRAMKLAMKGLMHMLPSKSLAKAIVGKDNRGLWTLGRGCTAIEDNDGKSLVSILLTRMWASMTGEDNAQLLITATSIMFEKLFDSISNKERIMALHILGSLFQISSEYGAPVLAKEGLLDKVVDCIDYEDEAIQMATLNALSDACSDKASRSRIEMTCFDYFKELMKSNEPHLRDGAAIILSKFSTTAADPIAPSAGARSSATPATATVVNSAASDLDRAELAKTLVARLIAEKVESETFAHALEAITYLTTKAEIKQMLCENSAAIKQLLSAAKILNGSTIQYGLSSILYNLTAYRRRLSPEQEQMRKLREFAKDIAKESESPLDDEPAVEQRIRTLVNAGIVLALVQLGKTESENIQKNVALTLLNCGTPAAHRGLIVQQGAVKTLLSIAKKIPAKFHFVPITNSHDNVALLAAAQCLAKLAISLDPHIAFRNTATSLVRPLTYLSQSESELHQFESMLALTNLASMHDGQEYSKNSIQARILQGQGAQAMEQLLFSENTRIRCAATEGICNMMMYPPMIEMYVKYAASKIRLLIALTGEDDFKTRRAASGALAILASASPDACKAIAEEKIGLRMVLELVAADEDELRHRGLVILKCITDVEGLVSTVVQHPGKAVSMLKPLSKSGNEQLADLSIQCLLNITNLADQ